ncbi:hypothetical protein KUM39_06785 [Streptomyces sp. J2-1]|uniref:SCO4225 family membrane protein n=1 Tax=Streptomyces corallincola TaxID=2851888 RepID=UPI001C383EFA|nr:hypothetical protein [Streptomyces corallincola]MBV2354070.1 hypothetical protein [Streptomyces corallincola]
MADTGGTHTTAGTAIRGWLLNPVALAYLALVAVVLVWVGVDTLFVAHEDASFAGIWAFVVTGPTSWLFVALPDPLPVVGLVIGALVQAAALGALYRWLHGRSVRQHRTGPHGA